MTGSPDEGLPDIPVQENELGVEFVFLEPEEDAKSAEGEGVLAAPVWEAFGRIGLGQPEAGWAQRMVHQP